MDPQGNHPRSTPVPIDPTREKENNENNVDNIRKMMLSSNSVGDDYQPGQEEEFDIENTNVHSSSEDDEYRDHGNSEHASNKKKTKIK